MHLKSLCLVFVMAVCFTLGANAYPQNQEKGILDSLIEKAKQAIESLTNYLQAKISDVLKYLETLKDQVMEMANSAIGDVKAKLEEIIGKAREAIDKIKEEAAAAGVDISECIQENEHKFVELFYTLLENEQQCVMDEVNTVLRMIQETANIATDAMAHVTELPARLQECINGSSPFSCVTQVLVDVASLEKDVPVQIARKIKEVTEFVSGLQTRLGVCATKQLGTAAIEAANIVAVVAKCAANKIGDQQLLIA